MLCVLSAHTFANCKQHLANQSPSFLSMGMHMAALKALWHTIHRPLKQYKSEEPYSLDLPGGRKFLFQSPKAKLAAFIDGDETIILYSTVSQFNKPLLLSLKWTSLELSKHRQSKLDFLLRGCWSWNVREHHTFPISSYLFNKICSSSLSNDPSMD